MFKALNVLAVLLTAAVLVVLRFAWYHHFAGVAWGALPAHLISDVQADLKVTALGLVNALVLSGGLVWLVGQTGERSPAGGLLAGIAAFVLFSLTTLVQPYIFGGQLSASIPQALLIDGGYLLASLLIGGLLIGLLVRKKRSGTAAARAAMFAAEH